MNSNAKETLRRTERFKYDLILEGVIIGALTGGIVSFFRLLLSRAEPVRSQVIRMAESGPEGMAKGLTLLFLLYAGTCLCLKFAPMISGSGIPQVKGELLGRISQEWLPTLIGKIAGGLMAIGAGLSLGREGPSVQIGAMVGKGFSRVAGRLDTEEKLLMTCGAGAGLSSAFSAPLAGTVFALEELHKNFSTNVLLSTMAASVTSDFITMNIFGLDPVFRLDVRMPFPFQMYWVLVILGVILGVFGVFYNRFTAFVQDAYDKVGPVYVKLLFPFALIIVFALRYPYVLGSGNELVGEVASGKFLLGGLVLLLIMKFLFSVLSFGTGAPGGIFLPLLVLGAISGGIFAMIIAEPLGLEAEEYLANFVVLGMTGLFASIVRSPVTGVILITEMTGNFTNFLALCIVALMAYVTADFLGGRPIYDQLLERMLDKKSFYYISRAQRRQKMLITSDVFPGSEMDGERIEDMALPSGMLIVSVERGETEMIPNGGTRLRAGDVITILLREEDTAEADAFLDRTCRTIRRDSKKER